VRRIALIGALAAIVAGCGSEAKKPAAAPDWSRSADAACQRAREAISRRGWAVDLKELQAIAPKAADDLRGTIAAIGELRGAPDTADVRLFRGGLRELEPMLDDMARAGTAMDVDDLPTAAARLSAKLVAVAASAHRAGLHRCSHGALLAAGALPDGVRAPVFAEQLARANRAWIRSARRDAGKGAVADIDAYETALDRLDPPRWIQSGYLKYRRGIRDLREVAARGGSPREFMRAARAADRQFFKFTRRLGARPVAPEPDADSEQES
jgi:hypothetical protein